MFGYLLVLLLDHVFLIWLGNHLHLFLSRLFLCIECHFMLLLESLLILVTRVIVSIVHTIKHVVHVIQGILKILGVYVFLLHRDVLIELLVLLHGLVECGVIILQEVKGRGLFIFGFLLHSILL